MGYGVYGVKDGGEKKKHRGCDTDERTHIPHKHPERSQKIAAPQCKEQHRQPDERKQDRGPVDTMVDEKDTREQHGQAEKGIYQGAEELHEGKDLQRKNHFLDIIGIAQNQRRSSIGRFGKNTEGYQSDKQRKGERGSALTGIDTPPGIEDDGKDEGVDAQHDQRLNERPSQSHIRSLVTPHNLTPRQLANQVTVVPEMRRDHHRVEKPYDPLSPGGYDFDAFNHFHSSRPLSVLRLRKTLIIILIIIFF